MYTQTSEFFLALKRTLFDPANSTFTFRSFGSLCLRSCKEKIMDFADEPIEAALMPCKSYCTQVANMCANRPDWIKLCAGLSCPDRDDAVPCTDGPTTELAEGCNEYSLVNFYSAGRSTYNAKCHAVASIAALASTIMLLMGAFV